MNNLEKLTTDLQTYLSEKGISQNNFAKMSQVASGTLGFILKGVYSIPAGRNADGSQRLSPISEDVIKKIERAMGGHIVQHWDIANYKACFTLFLEAKKNREHRIIDGLRGSGKTYTARSFQAQIPNETFIVTATEDMGPKDFVVELANIVGVETNGSRLVIRKRVSAKLKTMRNPLVIIDEAENFKLSTYGSVKALYDDVFLDCGLVLIGANNFIETLEKRAMRGMGCIPQVLSRFSAEPVVLERISNKEGKAICAQNGITDTDVINMIIAKSNDYRELDRNIKRYLRDLDLLNEEEDEN